MVWQTYSWDYETFGSFFGSKKACEPIHIQMNLHDRKVVVINTSLKSYRELIASMELFDLSGEKIYNKAVRATSLSNRLTECFTAELPQGLPGNYLIRLKLSEGKSVLSLNEYWESTNEGGSFDDFNKTAETRLSAKIVKQESGRLTFTVLNPAKSAVIGLKFNFRDPNSGKIILPAGFSDGYFTLLPGEKREMVADWSTEDISKPEVIAEGYNLKSQSLFVIR
jgi:hypothetical protein